MLLLYVFRSSLIIFYQILGIYSQYSQFVISPYNISTMLNGQVLRTNNHIVWRDTDLKPNSSTNITRKAWQRVKRIYFEILGMKGFLFNNM